MGLISGALALMLTASCSNGAALQQGLMPDARTAAATLAAPATISVTAKVARTLTSVTVNFYCTGATLSQGTLFFTDGKTVSKSLSGTSCKVSAGRTNLWYCRVKLKTGDYWYFDKNGDYWYFDRTGTWKPSSTAATAKSTSGAKSHNNEEDVIEVTTSTAILTEYGDVVTVTFADGTVSAGSTLGLSALYAGDAGGTQDFSLAGERDSVNLGSDDDSSYYVLATGDGTYWIFDSEGRYVPDSA